jgi:hypothetical protein
MVSILPAHTGWDADLSFALMVLSIVLLVLLLVTKELARARDNQWRALGHLLNVAIVPLLIAFAFTLVVRIWGALP